MRALRDRLLGLAGIAAALVAACSVFPDEAVLPPQAGGSQSEGGRPASEGGAGLGGGVTAGAAAGETGELPPGGAAAGGSSTSGSGGAPEGGQAAGQGGGGEVTPVCADPQEDSVSTKLDLWIGSAQYDANHGKEGVLRVSGGADERRALFELTVPAAPAGSSLLSAEVVLSLESNADASLSARRLGLYLQAPLRPVVETKATWLQYGSSKTQDAWEDAGGDLSEVVTVTDIPPGTASGLVRFDVTDIVRSALRASPQVYGIVILEEGDAPAAPAELAFTSREGNASLSPAPGLRLRYCQP
ncbi:MAG: DNRLRE domain-containing protein [Myxococcales bacterium]|nr:MAG: DNRLRE domain-containing protein [Myxococcales bacterium]